MFGHVREGMKLAKMINYKKKDAYIRSLYSYIIILVSNAIQNSR